MSGTAFNLGQYNEVLVTVARALPKALEGLDPKQVIKFLQNRGEEISRLLRKDLDILMTTPVFFRDMRKEGWELFEDVGGSGKVIITALEIMSFLRESEESVSGNMMRQRAVCLGANLGQRHAEFLLKHQQEIPKEWQGYYLVFPGTVWRDSFGNLYVPCLGWSGERWFLYFYRLDESDWSSSVRLLRRCK